MPARSRYEQLLRRQYTTFYWPLTTVSPKHPEFILGRPTITPTATSTPAIPRSPQRGGITFDGSTSWAVTDDTLDLHPAMSLSMWMRPEAAGAGTDPLIWESSPNSNSNTGAYIDWSNATWGFIVTVTNGTGAADIVSCTAPTLNAWNHLGVSFDRDADLAIVTIAINGVAQSLTTRANTLGAGGGWANQPFYLGSRGGSSLFWQGSISHFAIADRVVWTEADYLAQYECGVARLRRRVL